MEIAWRCIAESLRGPSHEADDQPCQDASAARVLGQGADACLVACVADGAGSAKHSDLGSAAACNTVIERATDYFTEHQGFATFDADDARRLVDCAREAVLDAADSRACPPREFATTLLVVIAGPQKTFFIQIGDGAIVLVRGGVSGVVFWPQSGEYANSTNFLTGDQFENHLEFAMAEGTIDELALLTDGLERLALVFETQTPHAPFCDPLFAGVRAADDLEQLQTDLRGFLDSESVRQRSDDDKSLVLASRVPAAHSSGPHSSGPRSSGHGPSATEGEA